MLEYAFALAGLLLAVRVWQFVGAITYKEDERS